MNERILELAEQAGITFEPMIIEGVEYEYNHVRLNDNIGDDEAGCIKKFAELIVSECMEQVWYTREDGINGNVSEVIKERMKQHFGVEE